MKNQNLYFAEKRNERCLIVKVSSSGLCVCRNKKQEYFNAYIEDLKKVY